MAITMSEPAIKPKNDFEKILLDTMMNGHNVVFWLTNGQSSASDNGLSIFINKGESAGKFRDMVLMHEAAHSWLTLKTRFYMSYLEELPWDINKRGTAYAYRGLTNDARTIDKIEDELFRTRGVYGKKSKEAQALDRIFGPLYNTWIGSLIQEDHTFNALEPNFYGHVFNDYHEFFASAINTMVFYEDGMVDKLKALKKEAAKSDTLNKIYEPLIRLLKAVDNHGGEFCSELEAHSKKLGIANNPELKRLRGNINRLNQFLKDDEAIRKRATQ